MPGIALVAKALFSNGSLIDRTGVAQQEQVPMRYRTQQGSEFIVGQCCADGPFINRIYNSIQEVVISAIMANKSTHGTWS